MGGPWEEFSVTVSHMQQVCCSESESIPESVLLNGSYGGNFGHSTAARVISGSGSFEQLGSSNSSPSK